MPRVNANGVELYYEEAGEGTPLILQAHALLPWLQFQVPFFAQRYRVITLDRRGTGRSASPEGDWTVADFTADVCNLMDALGIERAIIGGASLGGMIACQFGLDYPTRARVGDRAHRALSLAPRYGVESSAHDRNGGG